jgi:hypothetical protein
VEQKTDDETARTSNINNILKATHDHDGAQLITSLVGITSLFIIGRATSAAASAAARAKTPFNTCSTACGSDRENVCDRIIRALSCANININFSLTSTKQSLAASTKHSF